MNNVEIINLNHPYRPFLIADSQVVADWSWNRRAVLGVPVDQVMHFVEVDQWELKALYEAFGRRLARWEVEEAEKKAAEKKEREEREAAFEAKNRARAEAILRGEEFFEEGYEAP